MRQNYTINKVFTATAKYFRVKFWKDEENENKYYGKRKSQNFRSEICRMHDNHARQGWRDEICKQKIGKNYKHSGLIYEKENPKQKQ